MSTCLQYFTSKPCESWEWTSKHTGGPRSPALVSFSLSCPWIQVLPVINYPCNITKCLIIRMNIYLCLISLGLQGVIGLKRGLCKTWVPNIVKIDLLNGETTVRSLKMIDLHWTIYLQASPQTSRMLFLRYEGFPMLRYPKSSSISRWDFPL